jgi:hypothetical protein
MLLRDHDEQIRYHKLGIEHSNGGDPSVTATAIPRPSPSADPPPRPSASGPWVTVREFAALYNRTPRRIRQMLSSGDLMLFGIASYCDDHGQWWIRIPS